MQKFYFLISILVCTVSIVYFWPQMNGILLHESISISSERIQIPALGRVAALGDLYDARRDNFLDVSIYTTNPSNDAVTVTEITYSHIDFVRKETLSEKMEKLKIPVSLSLSILVGLFTPSGSSSANYLNEDKKSERSAKISLVYQTRTVKENLKINSDTSTGLVNPGVLEDLGATHVVVGIEWGTDVVLSLEDTNTNPSNVREIQGKLEFSFTKALRYANLSATVSGSIDSENFDVEQIRGFAFHFNGDIIPDNIPQTPEEGIAFIKAVPKLLKEKNNGKGKIMTYVLMPLSTVQKLLRFKTKQRNFITHDISKKLSDRFVRIFEEMKDSELKIRDVDNYMSMWASMISENDFPDMSRIINGLNYFRNDLKAKLATTIVKFRKGELEEEELKDPIRIYKTSSWTPAKFDELLGTYELIIHKIELMMLFKRSGALFVDRNTDKLKLLTDNYGVEVWILSVDLNIEITSSYVREIVRLLRESNGKQYYIEDDPEAKVPEAKVYKEGKVIHSFLLTKTEYVLLFSLGGGVIIMDANSFAQINAYYEPTLADISVAIVNDTLYRIDVMEGNITSTNVKNILALPREGIEWSHVGSFPKEEWSTSIVAAVNGSDFYFVTTGGILYKYDEKTVTECVGIGKKFHTPSLIFVDGILYICAGITFYSFNGTSLRRVASPEPGIIFTNLFEFEGNVCCLGSPWQVVHCYNPKNEIWVVHSVTNDNSLFAGVATTQSGTMIFNAITGVNSVEILNHDTKTWSYAPIPFAMNRVGGNDYGLYLAISYKR